MRLQFHSFEQPRLTREFAEDLGGGRNYAAFSPDGRWLAARGDQRLVVWDLAGDGAGAVVDEAGGVRLSFAPSGELFASREESLPERTSECFRWRVLAGTNGGAPILQRLPMSKPPDFVSLSLVSTGAMLTTMKGSKVVGYDQLVGGEGTWHATKNGLNEVSPNERWLGIFRSFTPHLYIYGLPGFEPVAKLTNEARISLFQFSPDGDEIAVSSRAGVEFWSTTNWQRVRHLTNFTGVLYSSDRTFWLYTRFRSASLHDARTLEPILPLPVGTTPLALSQDGRLLATSVDARRVQVWDLVEVRAQLEAVGLDWSERPAAARSNLRR